jgi:hypothetical protein
MTYQKNLQVAYHQQDTEYYCGAACAQMVLNSIGAGLLGQAGLYTDNHSHSMAETDPTVNWATGPDGLEWTLNDREPGGYYFVLYPLTSEDAISRKIAWTIEHYNVAPCALIMGFAHWIVVRGMEVSKAPASSEDTNYTISHFRVNDPWPPVPSSTYWQNPAQPPPPPHGAADGCGVGGLRGVADQVISYTQWKNTYMTGVPKGYWNGNYVAVCDPEPPPVRRGLSLPRERRFDGEQIISARDAIRIGMEWVEKSLSEDEVWSRVLREVRPIDPIIVQRLDRLDDYYYLVPLASERGLTTAAMAVDARFGDFQQAISLPETEEGILRFADREVIFEQVVNRQFELEKFQGYVHARKETITIPEIWFWKPCLESLSPFWPFRMVIVGGQRLYVRLDGQVFTTLHEDVHGI